MLGHLALRNVAGGPQVQSIIAAERPARLRSRPQGILSPEGARALVRARAFTVKLDAIGFGGITTDPMGIRDLTDTIRRKVGLDSKLGSVLKFDLGDDGVIVIDATESPNRVSNENRDAQCTVHMSSDDLDDMLRGKLEPMAAFGQGRLRLEGDMSVAMKLGDLVRGG